LSHSRTYRSAVLASAVLEDLRRAAGVSHDTYQVFGGHSVERRHVDPKKPLLALERAEQRPSRRIAVDFCRSHGDSDEHGRTGNAARQVVQQSHGCLVEPLDVVERDDEGCGTFLRVRGRLALLAASIHQHLDHRGEQSISIGLRTEPPTTRHAPSFVGHASRTRLIIRHIVFGLREKGPRRAAPSLPRGPRETSPPAPLRKRRGVSSGLAIPELLPLSASGPQAERGPGGEV